MTAQDNVIPGLAALIIRKAIAGQSANGYADRLSPDWRDIYDSIIACPPSPDQRTQAFTTAISGRQDSKAILESVFAVDPLADLESWHEPVNLMDLPQTDAGNAEALAALHGDRLRYDHRRRRWLVWRTHRWATDNDGEIERLALATVRERLRIAADIDDSDKRGKAAKWALGSENRGRLRALVDIARSIRPISDPGESWDSDPWLLGCTNGVVDLRTGELRPGKPGDLLTMSTGIEYNPQAKAERFLQFLGEVFNNDSELVEFVQRAAGYCLTGDIREHVLFLCWGRGTNGKSTLLNALRAALGEYATNTPFSTFELNQSSQTNDIAALYGLRFVTASETSESRRLNEARVKAITGGDPVTARFLFGEYFTYQPTYKVWLAMNHKPIITGVDEGIWRRIRLVPFTVSFKGREDKTLAQTLAAEKQGILAWAVQGALKWQAGGLTDPRAVMAATEEYRQESDILAHFLADCTIEKDGASVRGGDLYNAYKTWCKDNGEKELSGTTFGRRMKERGVDSVRKSGNVWYLGIGLITPGNTPGQDS